MDIYDLDKARYVVRSLYNYFKSERTIERATIELPNNIKWGSKEHFLYIFYGCLLDYGVKSSYYHKRLRSAYLVHPSLFNPEFIVKKFTHDINKLAEVLRSYLGVRFPTEAAKRWLALSYVLYSRYNGNPKNLIKASQNFNDLKKRILEIRGFGQKTGGLLIRILYENGLLDDISSGQSIQFIPIDRHDVRISIRLGIIKFSGKYTSKRTVNSNSQLERLSQLWVEASIREGVDPAETDRNLWLLGSELCALKK
ncbi:MAG: hypothetical protein GXO63_02145 [Candidatus Micrarchaeota archaeon]|nr:hypothetical protein [Candidatus Micrarchaeota archaeon]